MNQKQLASASKIFFIALIIDMAITALMVYGNFSYINALQGIQPGARQGGQGLFSNLDVLKSLGWLKVLTFIGVCWTLTRWLGVCYGFAKDTLKLAGLEHESFTLWCWWFPPVNLYKPYQVMSEIYRAGSLNYTTPRGWKNEPGSGLLLTWWLFWILAHLAMLGHARVIARSLVHTGVHLQLIELYSRLQFIYAASMVIAGLWFIVGNSLTQRLLQRTSRPLPHSDTAPAAHGSSLVGVAADRVGSLEDWAYEQVGKELDSNNPDKGAWTKAFAETGGDDKQTRVLYIKARVEKLIAMEQVRLEEARRVREGVGRVDEK